MLDNYSLVVNMTIKNRGANLARFDCDYVDKDSQTWHTQHPGLPSDHESLFMLRLLPGEQRIGRMEYSFFDEIIEGGMLSCSWRNTQGTALDTLEIPLQ